MPFWIHGNARLRRIANSKQRGVQHRQNAIDDVGQIWQALGDTVCYVDPHGCQFFLCRKELIAHIDKQAVCRITCHLAYRFAGVQTNKQFFLQAAAVCAGTPAISKAFWNAGKLPTIFETPSMAH